MIVAVTEIEYAGKGNRYPVQILHCINEKSIKCRCGKTVTEYYTKCVYNDASFLCPECAKKIGWI